MQVAPLANQFVEHFVIAHEVGHVLAHGRLMLRSTVKAKPSASPSAPQPQLTVTSSR